MMSPTPTSSVPSGNGFAVRAALAERATASASQGRAGGAHHCVDGCVPRCADVRIGQRAVVGLQSKAIREAAMTLGHAGAAVHVEQLEVDEQVARSLLQ